MCGCSETPDFWESKWIKAKVVHKCCECGSDIDIGEKYHKHSFLYDGKWSHEKMCQFCSMKWGEYLYELQERGCCIGSLWDSITDIENGD